MNLVFEKLSQILAAGYKWDIGIAGTYFRLSNCQWPCTVMLLKGGQVIGQMENMLAGDYVDGVAFDAVSVINGSTAQAIDVQISGGGAGSNRVLGEVSVIDGGKYRTYANMAFASVATIGASAGNFSHAELRNPVGSLKNIIIKRYLVTADIGASIVAGLMSTALVNTSAGISKLAGGAASVAQLRSEQNASMLIAARSDQFGSGANIVLQEPIVLPPGYSYRVVPVLVNNGIAIAFEWIEEGI